MSDIDQRPSIVSSVILRKDNKVAFVLRSGTSWMNGYYGLAASGRVEINESFIQAAVREAREEAGVDILPSQLSQVHVMHCKVDNPWIHVYFEASEYKGEVYNADTEAHSELVWLDPTKLPENTIPLVVVAMKAISEGKSYSEYGWDNPPV